MIKNTIVLIAIISFLFLSCGNYLNKNRFENRTKIKIPESAEQIQIFDNSFFVIVGKYIIKDKNEIQNFITGYGFKQLKKNTKWIIESDSFLNRENQAVLIENEFYNLSARTKKYRWNILINKTTGELWIEVLYPGFPGYKP